MARERNVSSEVAEANFAAAGANVISGAVVEIGQGNAGNAHVAGGGRLHRFADDLRGVGNRNQVEILAEGADQDRLPETFDGVFGLAVVVAPVEK